MPTTVRNTDILFNDATTQSTAAVVDTTNVLNAIAGASAGAVGTYMFGRASTSDISFGSTIAGSSLSPVSAMYTVSGGGSYPSNFTLGAAQSGTWRAMGTYDATSTNGGFTILGVTLWLRIS